MGDNNLTAIVYLCIDNEIRKVSITKSLSTAEDLCIHLCKSLGIGPATRHLFALRLHNNAQIWLSPNTVLAAREHLEFDLRLRFRIQTFTRLKKIDPSAFNYLFHQCKGDIMDNKIPEISYDKHKRELVGLGVTDMYRVMLEKKVDSDTVESDYKKYIPREVVKHHPLFFIKKPIHESLLSIQKCGRNDPSYVKGVYVGHVEDMAPNYLTEEFKSLTDEGGIVYKINLSINPFHKTQPGVRICVEGKKEWRELCSIEELCYISVRDDGTVEVSRRNGIPSYLKFANKDLMFSFVGLLDGYYRLIAKWTFNLCIDLATPSLLRLQVLKCHGPVGGEFSYAKLEEKRGCKPGCFILRESEYQYDTYYLDVCMKGHSKPKSYKIERVATGQFQFSVDKQLYASFSELISQYRNPKGVFYLEECLPPSEYDQSPLLLCQVKNSTAEQGGLSGLELGTPQCINPRTLQLFSIPEKRNRGDGVCAVYRCVLKLTKQKKTDAVMKVLKQEFNDQYLKEFLALTNQWSFLSCSAVVRFYGVTLCNPVSMVMEYLKLGPLDQYLRVNHSTIKQADLVEASTCLATALWHIEEHGMVHGNLRCYQLVVAAHTENTFSVKLTDPGLHQYSDADTHWLPIECYANPSSAATSTAADVWAFGTTIWEIFSLGNPPPEISGGTLALQKFYRSGQRLHPPDNCPADIYRLMIETWDADFHNRKKPQAIMRDINQILYQVFNSRRQHSYATVFPQSFMEKAETLSMANLSLSTSSSSLVSGATDTTLLDETKMPCMGLQNPGLQLSCDMEEAPLDITWWSWPKSLDFTNPDNISAAQPIFELDGQYNVVLQGRIGQGFYGDVYRGTLEEDKDKEPEQVAVKKLKTNAISSCLQDFEREISIMKKLRHPNIVQIKGVIREPEISLVMEFVDHGSLQSYLKIHQDTLSTTHLIKFALDVAKGMEYLGSKNIVHRDLAARNILVANENTVKISDFGLAQVLEKNNYYILKTKRELPIKWYAPESLRDGKFSLSSDVWSYGVTLYEMFSLGEEPRLGTWSAMEESQQLLAVLESGQRLSCPPQCPQSIYVQLMRPCWNADSHQRPTFTKLVELLERLMAES